METYTFKAEKLNLKQILPIASFVVIPFVLFFFSVLSLTVLVEFVILFAFCILLILLWHFNTKILINQKQIRFRSVYKKHTIRWQDVKTIGTFNAVGLSIINHKEKAEPGFFNSFYIYISTTEDFKPAMVYKNSKSFIRFNYDLKAYDLIKKYASAKFQINMN